jgi:two-component system response regulator AtoC
LPQVLYVGPEQGSAARSPAELVGDSIRRVSPAPSESTAKLSPDGAGYELLIAGHGAPWTLELAPEATLVIGRGEDADVRLVADGVSRRHAVLRVQAEGFTVEDLGSSNGTLVRGQPAPPRKTIGIAVGESFLVGEFVLLVRPLRSGASVRQVLSPEYLEARIAEQCERARENDEQNFSLLCVRLEAKPRSDPAPRIAAELKASDVFGRVAANAWAVLLIDYTSAEVTELSLRIQRALAAVPAEARVTVLEYPRDGTSASSLLAVATVREDDAPSIATDVVVRSPAMVALHAQIEAVARSNINVLILGETGVGKDVLARHIHERSERGGRPFVRVNCVALAESLLESELFGHEKGAFTGAVQRKVGLLESASGGTVFLDEIGDLPARLQPKLLQALETREVLSLGSVRPRSIDVRFIAATNRDLEADALSGIFRSDLYYRLAGFTAHVPPLRARREDILPLAVSFLRRAARGAPAARIREDASVPLLDYAWPGNIRELRNVMERALALSEGRSIGPEHLPLEKMRSVVVVRAHQAAPQSGEAAIVPITDLTADELAERERIVRALHECAGNQSLAAELLGISRSTLLNRLNAYRIRRPRRWRQ